MRKRNAAMRAWRLLAAAPATDTPPSAFAALPRRIMLGATLLLFTLPRRGAAAPGASLFYLVPPVTALIAYLLFGDRLGLVALLGMAAAVPGVAPVTCRPSRAVLR